MMWTGTVRVEGMIDLYVLSDLPALLQVEPLADHERWLLPYLREDPARALVCRVDDEAVAYVVGSANSPEAPPAVRERWPVHIHCQVREDHRDHGIGTALVFAFITTFGPCHAAVANGNLGAMRFWPRLLPIVADATSDTTWFATNG
jgi:GNAT superfamily N-acetyltransferase